MWRQSVSKHKTKVTVAAWYPGDVEVSPKSLADALGDLRYDSLVEYLDALAEKLQSDSEGDGGRGRGKLAACLQRAAYNLDEAVAEIRDAWKICEPYTKVSNADK